MPSSSSAPPSIYSVRPSPAYIPSPSPSVDAIVANYREILSRDHSEHPPPLSHTIDSFLTSSPKRQEYSRTPSDTPAADALRARVGEKEQEVLKMRVRVLQLEGELEEARRAVRAMEDDKERAVGACNLQIERLGGGGGDLTMGRFTKELDLQVRSVMELQKQISAMTLEAKRSDDERHRAAKVPSVC
jgi:hypothetical protein